MQVLLASRPVGWVTEENFKIVTTSIPKPADGQILVRNHYLSLDPYMRGRMNDVKSYAAKQELDQVMVGGTVGEVIESAISWPAPTAGSNTAVRTAVA
jgi:NADPH-dependent curcumin reductase CurA